MSFSTLFVILVITVVTVVNCLEPLILNDVNKDVKEIIGRYISKIPDINSKYVINDELAKVINHYFKGKITTFPLYKISLKIDRNPVKIPWTIDAIKDQTEKQPDKLKQREYKVYIPPEMRSRPKSTPRVTTVTTTPKTTPTE